MTPTPPPLDASVYRHLFDAYPDAVLLVNATGGIALANAAAAQLLGYSVAALAGMNVDALVPNNVALRHHGLRQGYAQAPHARPMGTDVDLTARRADGSEVMVEISLSPLQSGSEQFVVTALRGIGAYPRVQRAMQRARYNDHMSQAARAAVDLRDPQLLIARVAVLAAQALDVETVTLWRLEPNRLEFRIASSFGTDPEAVAGKRAPMPNRPDTLLGFVAGQGAPLVVSNFARENRFNVAPVLRHGALQCALAVPMFDAGRVFGVLVAASTRPGRFGEDEKNFVESLANLVVTSLQRAQTEAQLAHAQRLEAVGQLTGGIAHDFNNLLTIMQGNLQMLADHADVAGNALLSQMVSSAARAGQRGADLTSKLLAFSRRQALAAAPVDVGALLGALADMLRRTLGEVIQVVVQVHPACPPCLVDPGQLESALLNIAINSRDAMPGGGTLTFSCAPLSHLPPEMHVASGVADGLAITIVDTGEGMSPEVLDRAVEPFFTTKEAGKGTGLGLSTVYGFVKQSGGQLQIHSKPGQGTSVVLYLPALRARHAAPQPAALASPAPGPELQGVRILIVEDDADVRGVAVGFCTALGASVHACADAAQALTELQRDAGFDLLFSDITLGAGLNGIELAAAARAMLPGLGILLTSGYSEYLADADADKPQPWPVLHKPYAREALGAALRRALGQTAQRPLRGAPATEAAAGGSVRGFPG
ncbi:MAG: ATP-binding protein [Burkholderiaceae bacterium]